MEEAAVEYINQQFEPIPLVSKIYDGLLNQYERSGVNKNLQKEFKTLFRLDSIAGAYNQILLKNQTQALKDFCALDFLPLRKEDDPGQKSKDYDGLDTNVKDLLFKCIITISKLIEWVRLVTEHEIS